MIRPATPADTPALLALTSGTDFFKPSEIDILEELLDDLHASRPDQHFASVFEADGVPVGFEYHAPAILTDRGWYLYWIVVDVARQGAGVGRQLLAHAEADIRGRGGRLLIVETSTLSLYAPTRAFYAGRGYAPVATVPDYYADGDGQAVYTKRLSEVRSSEGGVRS